MYVFLSLADSFLKDSLIRRLILLTCLMSEDGLQMPISISSLCTKDFALLRCILTSMNYRNPYSFLEIAIALSSASLPLAFWRERKAFQGILTALTARSRY